MVVAKLKILQGLESFSLYNQETVLNVVQSPSIELWINMPPPPVPSSNPSLAGLPLLEITSEKT